VTFSAEVTPGQVVVTGDVDMATAAEFRAAMTRAALDLGPAPLTVDLTRVKFFDSHGIRAVYELTESCRIEMVVSPGSAVEKVMHVSGLADRIGLRQGDAG
jgi:anti-anti-sigma factor